MIFGVDNPKFLMLNGKNAFPGITYEHFLIDVINGSLYFAQKRSFMEHYRLMDEQSHGEDDVFSSTYQLDFKLLVSKEVMRELNKNMPEVDYSKMSQGFIFTKTKEKVSDIPQDYILRDIKDSKIEDLRKESYKNSTIFSLIKNFKKPKNLFMYYPYEYKGVSEFMMRGLDNQTTDIFRNVLTYRDELDLNKDTFVCFKINDFFAILEWVDKHFILRERVSEFLCGNYRDAKAYSVY